MWLPVGVLTLEPTTVLVRNGIKNPSLHYFHLPSRISNAACIKVTNKIVTSEQVKVTFLSISRDTTVSNNTPDLNFLWIVFNECLEHVVCYL